VAYAKTRTIGAGQAEHCRSSGVVVRGGVEPPTFRFSGVAAAQVRSEDQACQAARVRARTPMAGVVAVRVAVMPASWITSECRPHAHGRSQAHT
jgi:hypothetical protein